MKLKRYAFVFVAILIAAGFSAPSVSAAGSKVWTTTADFDSGNKSDPGPIWFARNGQDQPQYNFITQPQAVYSSVFDRLYVTYFADANGSIYVTYYDYVTTGWHAPHWIGLTHGDGPHDGHANAAIWVLTSGKIIVVGFSHSNALNAYRTTTSNGNIDSWEKLSDPDTAGTYSNMFEYPAGTLWLFFREGALPFAYRKSTNDGSTWSNRTNFIDFGSNSIYFGKWKIVGNRFYLPWVKQDFLVTQSRINVYVAYMDLNTGKGFSLNGTDLGTTITEAEANANLMVIGPQNGTIRKTNIPSLDVFGTNVYLFYTQSETPFNPTNWHLNFTKWNGASWSETTQIAVIGADSSFADLRLTSDTTGEAFITTTGIETGCTGNCLYTGDLERWIWNGSVWSKIETIIDQTKAGDTVNHPYYPLYYKEPIRVIFDQFISGQIGQGNCGATGGCRTWGDQKLYAWGSKGFVGRSDQNDGLYGVQTNTENKYVSTGTFTLANARNDKFSRPDSDAETYNWRFMQMEDGTGDCVKSFTDGVFYVNWSGAGSGTGRRACGLRGQFGITGDVDIRIRANATDISESGSMFSNLNVVTGGPFIGIWGSAPDPVINGIHYQFFNGLAPPFIRTWNVTSGAETQIGGDTNTVQRDAIMRITRVGTTWTTYFSINGGASWTTDKSTIKPGITGKVYISFGMATNSVLSGTVAVRYDDFDIASGTLDSDSFRTKGKWDSPVQVYNGEVAKSIVVTYSGANTNRYVGEISVVDSAGNVLLSDTLAHTTGTIANFTITDNDQLGLFNLNWGIRIRLFGDGSGSVVVNDVTVYTTRSTLTIAISDGPWLFGFFALITLGLIGAVAIRRKRGGRR